MLCTKPFYRKKVSSSPPQPWELAPLPCGQCKNCRINFGRIWEHRLWLELQSWDRAAMVTLTYDDDHIPDPPDVSKAHARKYIDRVRSIIRRQDPKCPRTLRYFIVGEYGPKTWRPHYHAIIFGVDGNDYRSNERKLQLGQRPSPEAQDDWAILYKSWPYSKAAPPNHERISIGPVDKGALRYTVGYIGKKLTRPEDGYLPYWLSERRSSQPEFSLKSNGLGREKIEDIAALLEDNPHVPFPLRSLRKGKNDVPLGRYLTKKLAEYTSTEIPLVEENLAYLTERFYNYRGIDPTEHQKALQQRKRFERYEGRRTL